MFLEQPNHHRADYGWIEVICGSMFSGKTEELIRRLRRAKFARQRVAIFKPTIDTRYHASHVVSHDDNAIPGTPVHKATEILDLVDLSHIEVVGIDEGQFFDMDLPDVCNTLANNGKRVVIAGLDMDFNGKPFGPMPHLMAIAEYVTKVHAICVRTGNLAHYSHRLTYGEQLIELGEKSHYEPLSREAFVKIMKEEQMTGKQDAGSENQTKAE
jgi:thymidine kinase